MSKAYSLYAAAFLVAASGSAYAVPVAFTQSSYTASALSSAGDASDGPQFDATPSALPFSATSAATGSGGDFSSSTAFNDSQFLTTNSQATSVADAASATATSTFSGSFDAQPGTLNFMLNFDSSSGENDTALANGLLTATLKINGVTVYNQVLTSASAFDTDYTLTGNGIGVFTVSLTSSSYAVAGGFANNAATADFSLDVTPVPEPANAILMLSGLMGIGLLRRRARSARG
jgi:hypothetical protein